MSTSIKNIEEIISDSFGMWIIGLWGNIGYHNPDMTFHDQKLAFFELLHQLLNEGKVTFVKPNADVYHNAKTNPIPTLSINDPESHWDASSDEIINHLELAWPQNAADKDDLELNAYFYEIPAIIWKDDDGKWCGS